MAHESIDYMVEVHGMTYFNKHVSLLILRNMPMHDNFILSIHW